MDDSVQPTETRETTIAEIWPSLAAYPLAQRLGKLYAFKPEIGSYLLSIAALLASIPVALAMFAWSLHPLKSPRYTLTNRRIGIQTGPSRRWQASIDLDRFDSIEISVLPGQKWYRAGDLVFKYQSAEVFRLPGVPHPEPFRQTCLKAHTSFCQLQQLRQEQLAVAAAK